MHERHRAVNDNMVLDLRSYKGDENIQQLDQMAKKISFSLSELLKNNKEPDLIKNWGNVEIDQRRLNKLQADLKICIENIDDNKRLQIEMRDEEFEEIQRILYNMKNRIKRL